MIARATALILLSTTWTARARDYDPLHISTNAVQTLDLKIHDPRRKRDIPVLIYLTESEKPASVVLFSHGLGGSRSGNPYLGTHWARRGYTAVFVQHPGSDHDVWQNIPPNERMKALEKAAGGKNYMLRVKDIPGVIDQLTEWNTTEDHPLCGKLDLDRIGMSGHSFGALTTQAVSGQSAGRGRITFRDPRIKAACAFSPSIPALGKPEDAFSTVDIPWMIMTGTKDDAFIGNSDAASRLRVYPALPAGGKYEVVLHNAEHSAFGERGLPGDREPRNPNHHRVILALSTAFWDAHLAGNPDALAWLNGDGPKSVLEKQDRWQRK
ncbi:alpha/beta hydrolase family protein [Pontiella sp.]|uniref:alpha/beta hydrolase family protein n=1 Tax=Pontiella sp. TaxID=2837462 RepID=UPI00356573BA